MFKINRFKPVSTFISDSFTGILASTNSKTLLVTFLEGLVTCESLESGVTFTTNSIPAWLTFEVIVKIFKETVGFFI